MRQNSKFEERKTEESRGKAPLFLDMLDAPYLSECRDYLEESAGHALEEKVHKMKALAIYLESSDFEPCLLGEGEMPKLIEKSLPLAKGKDVDLEPSEIASLIVAFYNHGPFFDGLMESNVKNGVYSRLLDRLCKRQRK